MESAPLRRSKRIEKTIAEINRKIRRAEKKNRESLIAKREALKMELAEENWNPEVKVLDGDIEHIEEHIEDIELMEDLEWTWIHFSIELDPN